MQPDTHLLTIADTPVQVDVLCNARACWWVARHPTGEPIEAAETNYPDASAAYHAGNAWLVEQWTHAARALASPLQITPDGRKAA